MISANRGKPSSYYYNALHQRVAKSVNDNGLTTTYYAYDEQGQVLGEYDNTGYAEHIYLEGIPVGFVKNGNIYYVHTDYLNTPRAISNGSTVVWRWNNTNPYGSNLAEENISGTSFEYNLRFTGQYFDKETALHYNYHRMYNPELGRYMQPDPIGVNGGMNGYSYVENNPLNAVDPLGLLKRDKEGNLIFKKIKQGNFEGTSITIDRGFLYTDKGNPIIAFKRIGANPPGLDYTADCHGWSFANGQYWIDDEQISTILSDEYFMIDSKNVIDGDIAIYSFNDNIQHSLTVKNTSSGYMGFGKGGNQPRPDIIELNKGWKMGANINYYRKK